MVQGSTTQIKLRGKMFMGNERKKLFNAKSRLFNVKTRLFNAKTSYGLKFAG